MTPNVSLKKSIDFTNLLRSDFLQGLSEVFPSDVLNNYVESNKRDRIYSTENTVLSMIHTATQEDKSLKNSVFIFQNIYQRQCILKKEFFKSEILHELESHPFAPTGCVNKVGRPKTKERVMKKSIDSFPSSNTAAYSKARSRLDLELFKQIFIESRDVTISSCLWHGKETFITDGTVCQMQDSEELRKSFNVVSKNGEVASPYPQALLQGIIKQGSGCIWDFKLGNRNESELCLLYGLIQSIPKNSVLLADDLYNTYATFYLCKKHDFDIIVPGKRVRNYKVLEIISNGLSETERDEIVEITKTPHPNWLPQSEILPQNIQLRRLSFISNDGKLYVLYTTILDKSISKVDIILKYFTRWDIEISIREIKTIMHINILRSKTKSMVEKELASTLIAYNLLKKVISKSTQTSDFPPERNIFQEFNKNYQDIFIDRKGRVYNRWSKGRYAKT